MIKLGNKVIVTDPCYRIDTWCNYIVNNVLVGEYNTLIKTFDGGSWGERVKELIVLHKDYKEPHDEEIEYQWKPVSDNIGVDSGQCGVYDLSYRCKTSDDWIHNSEFYKKACKCTDKNEQYGEQDNAGVTSRTGFGDGTYTLFLLENSDGHVVGFRIVYQFDDEE